MPGVTGGAGFLDRGQFLKDLVSDMEMLADAYRGDSIGLNDEECHRLLLAAVKLAAAVAPDRPLPGGLVLADRERELLEVKGPCSNSPCRLHYAHSGPCDIRPGTTKEQSG